MARIVRARGSSSSSQLLTRILERPELVAAIDKLSAPVLFRLISHVGVEDAGELIAVATTEQLQRVWDRDLWTRADHDAPERFAPERFALWLEVMLEAGEARTAERLRELPFDLLSLGVHRLVRVVEHEYWLLESEHANEEDESGPSMPWHELILIARDEDAWESVIAALLALDEEDHELVRRVLERCRDIDAQLADLALEPDQIYSALTREDSLESDLAAIRDERQSAAGYVSATDAQSFLRLARSPFEGAAEKLSRDPIASAYFRELAPNDLQATDPDGAAQATGDLVALLAEAGALGAQPDSLPLLPASSRTDGEPERAQPATTEATLLRASLARLASLDAALWSERTEELSFVANAVLAAGRNNGRAFEARAALEAAGALGNLGLELQVKRSQHDQLDAAIDVLKRVPIDRLFRAGSARAYVEVSLPARRALALRCARYAPDHAADLGEAIDGDELGAWPDALDATALRMSTVRLHALRCLAEAIPRLPKTGCIGTRSQLHEALRLLRPRARSRP